MFQDLCTGQVCPGFAPAKRQNGGGHLLESSSGDIGHLSCIQKGSGWEKDQSCPGWSWLLCLFLPLSPLMHCHPKEVRGGGPQDAPDQLTSALGKSQWQSWPQLPDFPAKHLSFRIHVPAWILWWFMSCVTLARPQCPAVWSNTPLDGRCGGGIFEMWFTFTTS